MLKHANRWKRSGSETRKGLCIVNGGDGEESHQQLQINYYYWELLVFGLYRDAKTLLGMGDLQNECLLVETWVYNNLYMSWRGGLSVSSMKNVREGEIDKFRNYLFERQLRRWKTLSCFSLDVKWRWSKIKGSCVVKCWVSSRGIGLTASL